MNQLETRIAEKTGDSTNKSQPIFKNIFGDAWDNLPPVMLKHYANRPYTNDVVCVEGKLDVFCKKQIRIFKPLFSVLGSIPLFNEQDVPVIVHFESDLNSNEFRFNRIFHFKNNKKYYFRSRMVQVKNNEVVEIMRYRIGWRMKYLWQDEKVILQHKGYVLSLFGYYIPIPITALVGKCYAEEVAVDEDTFTMSVNITHPLWGVIYGYKGQFEIIEK